jgi:hypothetical protein
VTTLISDIALDVTTLNGHHNKGSVGLYNQVIYQRRWQEKGKEGRRKRRKNCVR